MTLLVLVEGEGLFGAPFTAEQALLACYAAVPL